MKNIFLRFLLFLCFAVSANVLCGQTINTLAGNGTIGFTGDGVQATATGLDRPWATAVDAAGNVYIADQNDQRIRKVATSGVITTVAGNGIPGYFGDGSLATNAQIFDPTGIAVDGSGNIYIAEYSNHVIRKVNTAGIISTVAGTGTAGFTFDGIAATGSQLNNPKGVAVDAAGNIYIADYRNTRIRKVNTAGMISTVAGNGAFGYSGDTGPATDANLFFPDAIAVDGSGNLYIADENNNAIRKVSGGIINTIAGNGIAGYTGDGIPAMTAELNTPEGVAVDFLGNVYIADYTSQRIRKVNTSGFISTVAGTGAIGFFGEGIPATAALLDQPSGVTVDGAGSIYITDQFNNRIRKMGPVSSLPPITGVTTICVGGTSTLTDASAGGTWTSTNTTIATISTSSGVVIGVSAGTSIMAYTVSGSTVFAVMTINPFPVAGTITGAGAVCTGSTITLTDASPGGVWSASNTNASVTGGVVAGLVAGTDIISYTVSNSCGIAATTHTITISLPPVAGTISGPSIVCEGSVITLTDAVFGGTWTAANTNASVSGGTVTGVSAGTDVIIYSVSNSCGTVSATKAITVNPFPVVGSILGSSAVCVGASISLSDATPGGIWSASNSKATVSGSGLVTGFTTGIDTVSYAVTNSCGTGTVTKAITINPAATAGTITGPTSVCQGAVISLSDIIFGGVWSVTNVHASVSPIGVVTGVSTGIDTIVYTVTSACGTAVTKATITVNSLPVVAPVTGAATACAGTSIQLTDVTSGGTWSSNNTGIATVSSTGLVTGIVIGAAAITYKVTNPSGCSNTAITAVSIGTAMPSAIVLPSGTVTICEGSVAVYVVASGLVTYQWMLNGTTIPGATNISYTAATPGSYSVSVSNGTCIETMTGTTVLGRIMPTLTFTPPNTLSTGSFLTYEWYLNGKFIPGATTASVKTTSPGKYTVAVLDENLCHDTSAVYNIGGVGVTDVSSSDEIKVYPNPATSTLNIDAPVKVNISLLSMDGRLLVMKKDATDIDVSNLANGLYLVMIYDENNVLIKTAKFAKAQ